MGAAFGAFLGASFFGDAEPDFFLPATLRAAGFGARARFDAGLIAVSGVVETAGTVFAVGPGEMDSFFVFLGTVLVKLIPNRSVLRSVIASGFS